MATVDYLELNIADECFAVYPRNMRLSEKLFRIYPLRGGICLRRGLKWLHFSRMDDFFLRKRNRAVLLEYGTTDAALIGFIERYFKKPHTVCFFYPSKKRSSDRIYGYALNTFGEPVAYIKIARNLDWGALQHECVAVGKLDSLGTLPFRYPRCLGYEPFTGDSGVAVFSMLPETATPLVFYQGMWEKEIRRIRDSFAISRKVVSYKDLADERWVCDFKKKISPASAFDKAFTETLNEGVEVSWIHGDFAGHNFRKSEGTIWLFDWEEMTEHGPILTDEICFFLCVRRYELGWSLKRVLSEFKRKYLDTPFQTAAIQAIAFLCGRSISMGNEMVEQWSGDN